MDHSTVREQLRSLASAHVPRNSRQFKFRIYDDKPHQSTLGLYVDPKPFQGTVIATSEAAIFIKTGRTEFAVVDKHLASQSVETGTKVEVTPYARRRFDGMRADTPTEQVHQVGGQSYTTRTSILGGATVHLPLPKARCEYLADLIEQIEKLPAPDGFRRITHLLVDAGAQDFSCVDPSDQDIIRTPPAFSFTVNNSQFAGRVTVLYERGSDTYAVERHRDGLLVDRADDVYFDSLGTTLEGLIDDGRWRQIKIEVLPGKNAGRQYH